MTKGLSPLEGNKVRKHLVCSSINSAAFILQDNAGGKEGKGYKAISRLIKQTSKGDLSLKLRNCGV